MMATVTQENGTPPSTIAPLSIIASTDSDGAVTQQKESSKMPFCSGLSALIQAATEQLGHLVDADNNTASDASELSHQCHQADGYASSSDGDGLRATTPTLTPTIFKEDGKKLTFPALLMTLLLDPDNSDIITFLPDGKFFAIRTNEFAEDLMIRHFNLKSIEGFLELMKVWGFDRINGNNSHHTNSTIQVFRHPHFKRGAIGSIKRIRFGQDPTDARMSAMPDRARIEYTMSEDSQGSSTKRRLSPSHVGRDSEDTPQKQQRAQGDSSVDGDHEHTPSSMGTTSSSLNDSNHHPQARRRSSTEIRSYALAITTSKLDLHCSDEEDNVDAEALPALTVRRSSAIRSSSGMGSSGRLVDGAVEKATHTIVTDAIETLLFDEGHTRETYRKHEKELSKSSLPGVIPISQQLFAPPTEGTQTPPNEDMSTPNGKDESFKENRHAVSPSQLEAAAALMKQAGAGKSRVD